MYYIICGGACQVYIRIFRYFCARTLSFLYIISICATRIACAPRCFARCKRENKNRSQYVSHVRPRIAAIFSNINLQISLYLPATLISGTNTSGEQKPVRPLESPRSSLSPMAAMLLRSSKKLPARVKDLTASHFLPSRIIKPAD